MQSDVVMGSIVPLLPHSPQHLEPVEPELEQLELFFKLFGKTSLYVMSTWTEHLLVRPLCLVTILMSKSIGAILLLSMNGRFLFVYVKVLLAFSGGLNSSAMLRIVHEVGCVCVCVCVYVCVCVCVHACMRVCTYASV